MYQSEDVPELLPISKFVQLHAPAIVQYCEEVDPDEFARLQDPLYAEDQFKLSVYAFFKVDADIEPGTYEDQKYGKTAGYRYEVAGIPVRLTSQWFKNKPHQYQKFIEYLAVREILTADEAERLIDLIPPASPKPPGPNATPTTAGTFHIGVAQNAWVKNVLDRLRPDTSSYGGKVGTLQAFDHQCAYCSIDLLPGNYDEDHVYSINFKGLGENKRGNLVPACKKCNSDKSAKDFRKFLTSKYPHAPEEAERRIVRIERHMANCDYVPLREDPDVDLRAIRGSIESWRLKVKDLADGCIAELHEIKLRPTGGSERG